MTEACESECEICNTTVLHTMNCREDEAGQNVPVGEIECYQITELTGDNCVECDSCAEVGVCLYFWSNNGICAEGTWTKDETGCDDRTVPGKTCFCPDAPGGLPQPGDLHWSDVYLDAACGGPGTPFIGVTCATLEE